MATTGERNTQRRDGIIWSFDLAAGAKINRGALVVLDGGLAKPGHTGAGLVTVGHAEESADQTAGATQVRVRKGNFLYANSTGADEITAADIDQDCYLVDDETVAKTDGGGTRSKAGVIRNTEGSGVWIEI